MMNSCDSALRVACQFGVEEISTTTQLNLLCCTPGSLYSPSIATEGHCCCVHIPSSLP